MPSARAVAPWPNAAATRWMRRSYIGANPWQTVAITTAVGLLAGFLLGRRS